MWALKYSNAEHEKARKSNRPFHSQQHAFVCTSHVLCILKCPCRVWVLACDILVGVHVWFRRIGELVRQPELEPGQSEKKLFLFNARALHASKLHKQVFLLFLINLVPNDYLIIYKKVANFHTDFLLFYWQTMQYASLVYYIGWLCDC